MPRAARSRRGQVRSSPSSGAEISGPARYASVRGFHPIAQGRLAGARYAVPSFSRSVTWVVGWPHPHWGQQAVGSGLTPILALDRWQANPNVGLPARGVGFPGLPKDTPFGPNTIPVCFREAPARRGETVGTMCGLGRQQAVRRLVPCMPPAVGIVLAAEHPVELPHRCGNGRGTSHRHQDDCGNGRGTSNWYQGAGWLGAADRGGTAADRGGAATIR